MSRFAAIDVGSNALRCLIVEVGPGGDLDILENARAPVRLGTQVFLSGQIGAAASDAAIEAFRVFRRLMDSHDVRHCRAVATSAVREAVDGERLVDRVEAETGIRIHVIDGAEEAHLVRLAIAKRLDLSKGRSAAVDVGGGSVEVLALLDGDIVRTESFTMGAVRLLEVLKSHDGGGPDQFYALLTDYVDALRSRIRTAMGPEPADFVAATGGSAETLADLIGEARDGPPVLTPGIRYVPLGRLRAFTLELATTPFHRRVEKWGLREDRADVILPAAVVYAKVAEIFGVDGFYVPAVGLKDGLILDLVAELERKGAIDSRRGEIRAAALGLGRRYSMDEPHALKVTELALSIYDQIEDLHGLAHEGRTLLEAAAILHDVGLFVSAGRHHKHSYYLISQSDLVGLDRRQREIVANVARYHRRRHPTTKHPPFLALTEQDQEVVRRLAAILRAADVLDREHSQHVKSVQVIRKKKRTILRVDADRDLLLERWASVEKFRLFEEVFDTSLELEEA